MAKANYRVVKNTLLVVDVGPWDKHMTITNDAEAVVAELLAAGVIGPDQRVLYVDSDRQLSVLVVKNGAFAGFAPPRLLPEGDL